MEIRVEALRKAFGNHVVLDGVELTVQRTDVVAVVGGSGCGKTVLLNVILGLLTSDAGRIVVADHASAGAPLRDTAELGTRALERLHGHWDVVFQRNALFSASVLDNIGLWLRETRDLAEPEIRALAATVLRAVGLPSTNESWPATLQHRSWASWMPVWPASRIACARWSPAGI